MPRHQWLAPFLSVLLVVSIGGSASAQFPPGQFPQGQYPPGAGPGGPPPGAYPGGGPPLPMPGPGGAAPPPGMNPWPRITPFENLFDQWKNEDGSWLRETRNDPREYQFSIEYMNTRLRQPGNQLIGATGQSFSFQPIDPNTGMPVPPVFRGFSVSDFYKHANLKTEGLNVRLEAKNTDLSGFEANAWWATDVEETSHGIGLFDGQAFALPVFDPTVAAGFAIPYDNVSITLNQQAAGATGTFFWTPLVDWDSLTIRPAGGIRYMFRREEFNFRGSDSGNVSLTLIPIDDARIQARVENQMVGPEIGFRYDVGGVREDRFLKISGKVVGGFLVNREAGSLYQQLIGQPGNLVGVPSAATVFTQRDVTAHLSPHISGSVNFEMRVFQYVPRIKDLTLFENAVLRIGFHYTKLGEILRPQNAIEYRGFPAFSELRYSQRTVWDIKHWNFGVNWTW